MWTGVTCCPDWIHTCTLLSSLPCSSDCQLATSGAVRPLVLLCLSSSEAICVEALATLSVLLPVLPPGEMVEAGVIGSLLLGKFSENGFVSDVGRSWALSSRILNVQ